MEVFRVSRDVYGREVLQGMSWDLLWLFVAAGVLLVACHAAWRRFLAPPHGKTSSAAGAGREGRIGRHSLAARTGHWLVAICTLVLLATSLLPVFGIEFAWVTIHWVTGLVLTAVVLAHVLRTLPFRRLSAMRFGATELREIGTIARISLRRTGEAPSKPGKYSAAQKLIHHCFALVVLAALVTGLLMLLKIDTPWWERNPYVFSAAAWSVIYVVHGLSTLLLVTMVITHVYFALRPEKRLFLRAMFLGWISRSEFESHHDPNRWKPDP